MSESGFSGWKDFQDKYHHRRIFFASVTTRIRIVYSLYNLTPEEIAIVEGAANG